MYVGYVLLREYAHICITQVFRWIQFSGVHNNWQIILFLFQNGGKLIHAYKGGYWEAKQKQDWSMCPDIFWIEKRKKLFPFYFEEKIAALWNTILSKLLLWVGLCLHKTILSVIPDILYYYCYCTASLSIYIKRILIMKEKVLQIFMWDRNILKN